jgi:hypothetical protein
VCKLKDEAENVNVGDLLIFYLTADVGAKIEVHVMALNSFEHSPVLNGTEARKQSLATTHLDLKISFKVSVV